MEKIVAALAALAGSSTHASAETYFTLSDVQQRDGSVEFGTISTDYDALIEVYSFRNGVKRPLLAWEALRAGANSDTKVPLVSTPRTTALALFVVDGEMVASQRIRFVSDPRPTRPRCGTTGGAGEIRRLWRVGNVVRNAWLALDWQLDASRADDGRASMIPMFSMTDGR